MKRELQLLQLCSDWQHEVIYITKGQLVDNK